MKGFHILLYIIAGLLAVAAPMQSQPTTWAHHAQKERPWVSNASRPNHITHGLEGRHLSIWASHGRYYDQTKFSWEWQRPALFCTNEDLFTQTIVVPYLIPMLEDAGAVVFTPRERDWQRHEVIVDNDRVAPLVDYQEQSYRKKWTNAPAPGFAFHDGTYYDGENPFKAGTARMVETTRSKSRISVATYQPNLPEAGRYAVYVSYQTVANSTEEAHYTVWHKGEKTEFHVNQRMGGGTWVYLGTFDFDQGSNQWNCVVVSNHSTQGGVVTTDAVRFGGGMGNIIRGGTVSGVPRCLEGARYYAQWAGMPYRIYSPREGANDYADDINVRSLMTNYLCGGSRYAPDSTGLRVPIELSLAVHSDAGHTASGYGVYGTLSICTTGYGRPTLGAGNSRTMSRELADRLLDNTVSDLQNTFGEWTRRQVYDRNYSETRLPIVPSAILETMSHQNFGDMRYGQDPNFRFALARSVYKTLLRYVCEKHNQTAVVTPLAPQQFRLELEGRRGDLRLSWAATDDPLEPTARPTHFIVYTAEGTGGFDNGTLVSASHHTVRLRPGVLYSFRVCAANKGGKSFPTQTLSAVYRPEATQTVLVVDGFHRLSSPAISGLGFRLDQDPGITYGRTAGWLGQQQVFDPKQIGVEGPTGLGYSTDELAGKFIAGNEFNYVYTHADAIHSAMRYNIVSCSSEALGQMHTERYDMIDLLLGLECDDGHSLRLYQALDTPLRTSLRAFTSMGRPVLVSGAYIGTDADTAPEQQFLSQVLKCSHAGQGQYRSDIISGLGMQFAFHHTLNETHYAATHTDVLMPVAGESFCAMTYDDGTSAAVGYSGRDYRSMVLGFPFECIKRADHRRSIMQGLLKYLFNQ